jgi:hypothetical protein
VPAHAEAKLPPIFRGSTGAVGWLTGALACDDGGDHVGGSVVGNIEGKTGFTHETAAGTQQSTSCMS